MSDSKTKTRYGTLPRPRFLNKRIWLLVSTMLLALSATLFSSPTRVLAGKQLLQQAWTSVAKATQLDRLSNAMRVKGQPNTTKAMAVATKPAVMATTKLNIARQGHAAIRLSDGKILLVGGENVNGLIKESEIYNPVTHQSLLAANLDTARTEHTASALPDGRVLIVGGRGQAAALRSTEIYDPRGNTFSAGPNLNRPRAGHSANTLADGRILIAGGSADGSAEIYNPATNSFTVMTGALNAARSFHSAVTLKSGKVLLVGGKTANGKALNTAELFDPATQRFTATGKAMKGARVRAALNLLRDGKVQVIGGGEETMEIYNATGNYFTAYAHLPNNAATMKTPGRVAFYHRKAAKKVAAKAQVESFAAAATIESDDPTDIEEFTSTDSGNTNVIAGGVDGNGTTQNSIVEGVAGPATVSTDKTDYAPGEVATITGAGFLPNQTVSLLLERDPPTPATTTWTVQADTAGNFTTTYNVVPTDLDVTFILTASGQPDNSPVAQTTFTDGNVKVRTNATGITFNMGWTEYTNGDCTGAVDSSGNSSVGYSGNAVFSKGVKESNSIQFTATATSGQGGAFINWTLEDDGTVVSTNLTICVPGNFTNTRSYVANYAACTTPAITTQPSNQIVTYGAASATFSAAANGSPAPSVQWQISTNNGGTWNNVPSATNPMLTVANPSVAMSGNQYRAVFTNSCGTATTNAAPLTVNKASSTTTVTCSPSTVTYNGSAQTPCTASYSTSDGLSGSLTVSYSNNTNAGTATGSASYVGDANHDPSNGSANFTITKAPSTTTVTCSPSTVTYNGTAQTPCTVAVTGAGGLNLSPTPTYTNNTNAGTATASYSYAGDANHDPSSGSANFTINKAAVTATAGGGSATYDGTTKSPSACAVSGAYTGDLTCTNNPASVGPGAGTTTISPVVNGTGLTNFDITYVSGSYTINKASSATTITCPTSVTYNGSAQTPCTATATGAGGLSVSVSISYANNTNAGTATADASYGGDDNHDGSTAVQQTFVINKAAVTATAGSGAATYDGTTKSPSACAVTGVYTGNLTCTNNPASVGPSAGTTTISPVVSGAGLANFDITSVNGSYTINKAPVTVTAGSGSATYDGTTKSPSACVVSGVYTGDLTCTNNPASVGPGAGTTAISPVVTGTVQTNFAITVVNGSYTIAKAPSMTTITCPASVIYNGSAATPCSANVTGAGGLNQAVPVVYTNNMVAGTAGASATYPGDANHTGSSASTTFIINPRAALLNYIGQQLFVTSGTSATTAQVTLSASMQDPTGNALVGAKVDFIDTSSNKVLASGITVSKVPGSPDNTGTANTVVTLSTGQYGAESYLILVKATGNYDNTAQPQTDKTATVTVAKPAATNESIGGGTIAALSTSAGTYLTNKVASYCIGMTYNKSGTNLQGNIKLTIPQANGDVVYIKSNSISSMAVSGKSSTIYTKASIFKEVNGALVTVDGNVTLRVDLLDGNPDKVGFTVLSTKDSMLYYSNNWVLDTGVTPNVWKTLLQTIATGFVTIN